MTDRNGQETLPSLAGAAAVTLWVAGVLPIGGGHLGLPGGLPKEPAGDVLAFYSADADRVSAGPGPSCSGRSPSWLAVLVPCPDRGR